MQLKLSFLEVDDPTTLQWSNIDPDLQRALVQALARVIEKATFPHHHLKNPEDSDDR